MKEFNEYIETNQWLKKLMDELNEEDGMRLEDSFYAFKKHCTKAENLPISDVMQWVAVDDKLPPILETIWLSNGKGWTDLGCRVETNEGWHWAGQNGIIYQEKDRIVAECDSEDLDVVYWCKLPKPPCA
jgi:hypothetical protein